MEKQINTNMKRRKKGTGSVFQIAPDLWRGKITKNGKPFYFYGETEKEATKKLDDFIKKFSEGKVTQKRISYTSLLKIWLEAKKKQIKPQSYSRLEYTANIIDSELGFYDVDKLNEEEIQRLIDKRAKSHSFSDTKKLYDALNASLKFAKRKGMITFNPVEDVIMPTSTSEIFMKKRKEDDKRKDSLEIFTDDEIKRFVEASKAKFGNGVPIYRNSAMFLLMLNTGLRVSEAAALKWSDYDTADKTIFISKTLIQNKDENGKQIIEEQDTVKTKSSERVLLLNDKAIEAIESISPNSNSRYIFCAKNGKPLRPRNIQNKLDSILGRAGISHKSTHVFRHTYASKLFEKGVDVKIVSELLGHADVRTTYNTYIKLIKKQKVKAIGSIDMYD